MALQSDAAPPVVGEAKKDTYGDTKSDDTDDDDVDLEEGEILDSGNELGEEETVTKAPALPMSPLKLSNDQNVSPLSKIQEIIKKAADTSIKSEEQGKCIKEEGMISEYPKFVRKKYVDHDQNSDNDDENEEKKPNWYERAARKKPSPNEGPIDYRQELAMYAGSPKSSPERDATGESSKKKKRSSSTKSKMKKIAAKRAKRRLLDKRKPLKKTISKRQCKFFQEGNCVKGADCPFQHVKLQSNRKKELCRYYLTGYCQKGRQCTFMHEDFPCKFFHTGAKCYSGDNCRFSHQPLNEETSRLLQECLKGYHNDDHHNHDHHNHESRKRKSKSPEPPSKRPCLLGSPPRHIREAEETKRWQEEMFYLQREKSTDAFQIRLSPPKQFPPPPPPVQNFPNRPNFYVDTMQSPPKANNWPICPEQIMGPSHTSFEQMNVPFDQMNVPFDQRNDHFDQRNDHFDQRNDHFDQKNDHFDQKNDHFDQKLQDEDLRPKWRDEDMRPNKWKDEDLRPSLKDEDLRPMFKDQDLRPKLNWSSICALVESMKDPMPRPSEEDHDMKPAEEDLKMDQFGGSDIEQQSVESSNANEDLKEELEVKTEVVSTEDSCLSPPQTPEPVKEKEPIVIPSYLPRKQRELLLRIQRHQKGKSTEEEGTSESSDKLEAENLPNLPIDINVKKENYEDKCWSSSDDDEDADKPLTDVLKKLHQTPPPKPKEILPQKPQIDISQMLSNIMQKAGENKTDAASQEQGTFWQNILSGTVLPNAPPTTSNAPVLPILSNAQSETTQAIKRRVLLPNPKPIEMPAAQESRDPRLKSRDPRTATPKPMTESSSNVPPPFPLLPLEHRVTASLDSNSLAPSQTSAVVVDGLVANVPYKLYSMTSTPLNYTRYIQASHSDPKLSNDPRLRKYLSQETTMPPALCVAPLLQTKPPILPPALCAAPLLQAKPPILPDLPLFSNIKLERTDSVVSTLQDASVSSTHAADTPELKFSQRSSRIADPRTKRAEERVVSENNTNDNRVVPQPVVSHPSHVIARPVVSHLPRAIADPRMAKLHKPYLDPRRSRLASDSTNKNTISRLQPPASDAPSPKLEDATCEIERTKIETGTMLESKKNSVVHRNRKTSMDYASPLSSCNDNSSSLNYNSYNQRHKNPPRNKGVDVPLPKETLPSASSIASSLIPHISTSDSSALDCDLLDASASLKDMFKTIDPTASPFC